MTQPRHRIVLAGASGRMGQAMWPGLASAPDIQPVAALSRHPAHADLSADVLWSADPGKVLSACRPGDIWIDLTTGDAATAHVPMALDAGLRVIVGATGMAPETLAAWRARIEAGSGTVLVVPNFSLGAVLMMRFAEMAARLLPDVAIIESHHAAKRDAPSGTACRTAERIAAARLRAPEVALRPDQPALGQDVAGVPVHAIRMPGMLAHQEVVFGAQGEVLTIRHDAMGRDCFLPGLLLAIRKLDHVRGFATGLEHVLGEETT